MIADEEYGDRDKCKSDNVTEECDDDEFALESDSNEAKEFAGLGYGTAVLNKKKANKRKYAGSFQAANVVNFTTCPESQGLFQSIFMLDNGYFQLSPRL
jgi:hypothetical protein